MSRTYLIHLKDLLKANLKTRYRETWIGFLWVLINPIVLYSAQGLIFSGLFKTVDSSYFIYLWTGLFPWFFLTQTIEMSCTYLKNNSSLLRNLNLKPSFLISGLVLENYINFISSAFLTLLAISLFTPHIISIIFIIKFVVISSAFAFFVFLLSMIAAYSNVVFKDVKYIAHFLFTVLYFLTPTFYRFDSVPEKLQSVIRFNPFFWVIEVFHLSAEMSNFSFGEVLTGFAIVFLITALIAAFLIQKLHNQVYLKL